MKIRDKIVIFNCAVFSIILIAIYVIILVNFNISFNERVGDLKNDFLKGKKDYLHDIVKLALMAAESISNDESMSVEARKEKAKRILADLRYEDKSGYFFAYESRDGAYYFPFHGVKKDLWGKKADIDEPDVKGYAFRKELIRCAGEGDCFVEYYYEKPGAKMFSKKLSHAVYFPRWRWTIVGGIYLDEIDKKITTMKQSINRERNRIIIIMTVILCVCVVAFVMISVFYTGAFISGPIKALSENLGEIARGGGDLTRELTITSNDEIGDATRYFNQFVAQLKTIIAVIKKISGEAASFSAELTSHTNMLSNNAKNQAATSEEITATIEEISCGMDGIADSTVRQDASIAVLFSYTEQLSSIIESMSRNVQEARSLTEDISNRARSGGETLHVMSESMEKIHASSKDTSGILSIINDISERINLLSLNAAIEAARAGEQGRGFAVVADEISKLADQTSESIKNIASLISQNEQEIERGLKSVNDSNEKLSGIISAVESIRVMISNVYSLTMEQTEYKSKVNEEAGKVKASSNQIKQAAEEQKSASVEIVKSISNVNDLSQTTAFGSEEITKRTKEMALLAASLKDQVDRFKI